MRTATATATQVQVAPASTTGGESDDGELPWWGWVLIGLGVAAIVAAIYLVGRRQGEAGKRDAPPDEPVA